MKSAAKYSMIEFIRPDCFWPSPYTIEQAFGVLSWMVQTGEPYGDQTRWGRMDVKSLLSGKPTCVNFSEIDPITSLADLRNRFHYALLSKFGGPSIDRWRERFSVIPNGERMIRFPHHGFGESGRCEADVKVAVDSLLGASGQLTVQLNPCHGRARNIVGVKVHVSRTCRFVLDYGFDGSVWHHTLATQMVNEPWLNAFWRAVKGLGNLTGAEKLTA